MWSPPRPSVEWIVIAAIAAIYKIAANTPVIAFLVMSGRRQWQRCPCRRHDLRHRHWQPEVAPPVKEEGNCLFEQQGKEDGRMDEKRNDGRWRG